MKKLMKGLFALLLAVTLVACGSTDTPANDSKEIYVVLKTLGGAYWSVVEQGARDAAEELGYTVTVLGLKNETEIETQKNQMADAISAKPAAIIFAPADSKALASSVSDAKAAGIPVIMVDTLVQNEDYTAAYVTNNVNAGKEAAIQMIAHLKERGIDENTEGQIAIQKGADTQTILDRLEGFRTEWAASAPKAWTIAEDSILIATDAEVAFNQGVNVLTNKKIIGVFGTNNGPSVGWARAIEDQNRKDIVAVTFDYSSEVAKLIQDAEYSVTTIVQKQYFMGYEGVKAAVEIAKGNEPAEKLNDTGVLAVDNKNVNDDATKEITEAGKN